MEWTGIPSDGSMLLVGGIVIGLAVDDTIHFTHKFNRDYEDSADPRFAVQRGGLAPTADTSEASGLPCGQGGFAAR